MVILSPLEEENLKQELLNILHASSDLILTIYDPAQKMLQYVTTNIEKLFGYKPQELIGTNLYPLQSSNIHSRKTKFGHCYNLEIVLITTLYNGNILSIERIIQKESPLPIDTNLTPMIIIDSFGKLLWSNSYMDGLVGEDHLKTYGKGITV